MARPKSPRQAPDAGSAFVRFDSVEFSLITRAIAKQTSGVLGGGSVTVAAFVRAAALEAAKRVLGER